MKIYSSLSSTESSSIKVSLPMGIGISLIFLTPRSLGYWNAADDFGRLKIIISEGFQGRNPPITFERMRNIVWFSFQHAPLTVLEKASLAWPNAAMWRQPIFASPSKVKAEVGGVESHAHSPTQISGILLIDHCQHIKYFSKELIFIWHSSFSQYPSIWRRQDFPPGFRSDDVRDSEGICFIFKVSVHIRHESESLNTF